MKKWLKAFRLRTLPLAVSAISIGSALAFFYHSFNGTVFLLALITAICLQILSNLANDYGDFSKGTDNDARIGPTRSLQSGEISKSQMKNAIILFSVLSFIFGLSLLSFSSIPLSIFIPFLLLGLAAILAAIKYTIGNSAYGYSGFGDVFVFIFFGLVSVIGTFFLHSRAIQVDVILPAVGFGLFAVAVLNINNMRDIENDRNSNKNTLVVKIGIQKAKQYHFFLILIGIVAYFFFTAINFQKPIQWCFLFICPMLIFNFLQVNKAKKYENFDPLLKQMAIAVFIFSLTFCLGLLLSK